MGTTYHISIVDFPDNIDLDKLQKNIDEELIKINQLMSTYISDSEISHFNRLQSGQWFSFSKETLNVLNYSLDLSRQSGGKFDITLGPLISLWGFGAEERLGVPDNSQIEQVKQQVGWQSIVVDNAQSRVKKEKTLSIDMSAVAKGYGVDHLASLLEKYKITNYLVEIGGEIRVRGVNSSQQVWRIGIETPSFHQTGAQQVIALSNEAIATSGDYRNFFEWDGVRYSHTLDPITGRPVVHNIASLTVIADQAMHADGLATAMMAMGQEQALVFAEEQGIPVYILTYSEATFSSRYSSAFKQYLQ